MQFRFPRSAGHVTNIGQCRLDDDSAVFISPVLVCTSANQLSIIGSIKPTPFRRASSIPCVSSTRASPSRPNSPIALPREILDKIAYSENRCSWDISKLLRRSPRREQHPHAGDARQKSCNERTLRYMGDRDLYPRLGLPKRGKGLDPDSLESKSQDKSSSEAARGPTM